MIRLSKQVFMCCCLVLLSIRKVNSNVVANCSCYSFHGGLSLRRVSQNKCKKEGGDLVSMETLEEWKFIKAQVQNKTTEDGENEWWIGLQRTNDGNWTWLTNHSLTYHVKWLKGTPDDSNGEKYVTIVKDFNGTQGWFNQSAYQEPRGWICEYSKLETNCIDDKIPWCKPLVISINTTTKGSNQSDSIPPQHPSECVVTNNSTIIPIIIALVGLLVIVSINIIIVKWRCATNDSRKKRYRSSSHSGKLEMHAVQSNTSDMSVLPGSGINQDKEKCLQPDQEYIGSSTTDAKGGVSDGITDVDLIDNNSHKLKSEPPYYVNVPGINEGHTLTTDTGHYASVDDISETAGKKDGFVVVQTYSIVHHTDDNDGQTDTYATVNDVLDKDRQTDVLATTEPGYASVDVIKKTAFFRSGEHSRKTSDAHKETSHDTTGITQYAVVDFKRKSSKKIKAKEPDNQSQTEPGYASVDVIKKTASVRSGENSRTTSDAHKETSHDTTGITQYAVVDFKRKSSKKIKAKEPDNQSQTEPGYASVDVIKKTASVRSGENSRTTSDAHKETSHDATGTAQYAVVDMKRKRSKKIKAKEPDNQNQPESGASVDVSETHPSGRVHSEEHSRTANDAQNAPSHVVTGTTQYAVVDMKRKKSKKIKTKEPDHPKQTDVGASAEVIYDNCQYGPPAQDHEGVPGNNNSQQTLANNVPNTDVQVQYAAFDKSKKKNRSVKVPTQPNKSGEASYASVDVIYANCGDQEKE